MTGPGAVLREPPIRDDGALPESKARHTIKAKINVRGRRDPLPD